MGKYSVPDYIRELKPKGTMVKCISGHYYVYQYLLFVAPYEGKNGHNRQIILGTSLKDFYESNVDFFEGLLYTRVCLSPSGKQMR